MNDPLSKFGRVLLVGFMLGQTASFAAKPKTTSTTGSDAASNSATTGGGTSGSGQAAGQSPTSTSTAPISGSDFAESHLLAYNCLEADAIKIATQVVDKVTSEGVLAILPADAAAQMSAVYPEKGTVVALLNRAQNTIDELNRRITAATGEVNPKSNGSDLVNVFSSAVTALNAAIPQIQNASISVPIDSRALALAVANEIRAAGYNGSIILPSIYANAPTAAADGSFLQQLSKLAQQAVEVSAKSSQLQALVPVPADVSKANDDQKKAQNAIAGATTFSSLLSDLYTDLLTADTNGVLRVSLIVQSDRTQAALSKATKILIVRVDEAVAATLNDRGIFGRLWIIPEPHNDNYFSGGTITDFALFDIANGNLLAGGSHGAVVTRIRDRKFIDAYRDERHFANESLPLSQLELNTLRAQQKKAREAAKKANEGDSTH